MSKPSSSMLRVSTELMHEIYEEQKMNERMGIKKSLTDCSKDIVKYSKIGRSVLYDKEKTSRRLF